MAATKKRFYVFDFETRNSEEDQKNGLTSVWLWDICDQGLKHTQGTDLKSFLKAISELSPCVLYSHNLKFDSSFLISYWLNHGYKFVDEIKKNKDFSALCDDLGRLYFLKLRVVNPNLKKSRCLRNIDFRDSAKKINGSVEEIARSYGLPIRKLSIDHNKKRPLDYVPDDNERAYVSNDTEIIMRVLLKQYEAGLTKMTSASDSYNHYLESVGRGSFRDYFPVIPLETDDYIRNSWFGGIVIASEKYRNRVLNNVWAYDYNSLYAFIMCYKMLPYGKPIPFTGKPKISNLYPLYIIHFKACFKLKSGKFPHIQSKNTFMTKVEYISDTGMEFKELYLSSPDFELFKKDYEIFDIKYIDGLYFKGSTELFKDYLIPLYEAKKAATSGSDKEDKKILLTGLYGKFGTNPRHSTKKPILTEEGSIKWVLYKEQISDPVYTAMCSFICAYGHEIILGDMNSHYDIVAYGDTDSIHTVEEVKDFKIGSNLGELKVEHHFKEVKYIGSKAYFGIDYDKDTVIKCSGLPAVAKEGLTIEDFNIGQTFKGKLQSISVSGGTILAESTFTLRDR